MISEIGAWCVDEACRQIRDWEATQGENDFTVAINLDSRYLLRPELPTQIDAAIRRYRIAAERLKLEILETAMMDPTAALDRRKTRASSQVKTVPAPTANTTQKVSCCRGYRCCVPGPAR